LAWCQPGEDRDGQAHSVYPNAAQSNVERGSRGINVEGSMVAINEYGLLRRIPVMQERAKAEMPEKSSVFVSAAKQFSFFVLVTP